MNEPNDVLTADTSSIGMILYTFIVIFFALSALALVMSIIRGQDQNLAKSARSASWMSFFIGILLLYLRFVLA